MVTKSSREMQKDREKIRPPFGGLKFCQGTHYLPLTFLNPVKKQGDCPEVYNFYFKWKHPEEMRQSFRL